MNAPKKNFTIQPMVDAKDTRIIKVPTTLGDDEEPPECMVCSPFEDIDLEQPYKRSQEEKNATNQPHPALEYPMLYHAVRRFPGILEKMRVPYVHRWRLSYKLQHKVPFSRALTKLKVRCTWGELLLLVPFFVMIIAGIIYSAVYPSVIVSGKVARFALIAALVLAQRNSLVTLLLGMPVDRALFYHKLAGRVAGITGILHTFAYFEDPVFASKHQGDFLGGAFTGQVNISGSMIMLLIIAITVSSVKSIRNRLFEVFYYLHVIFAVGMVVSAFFHSGILVPTLAFLTCGADFFVRSVVMARTLYPKKAQLKIISPTVLEISFPKTASFAYNPGQYIYLAIPEISWLQWHPFSISSYPEQAVVTLHVRKAGDWTSSLFELAKSQKEVSILFEGPYGNLAVDIMSDRKYKNVMLVSGGIGITPMQSICDQLLHEKSTNTRDLHHLKFIWIERDPVFQADFVKRAKNRHTKEVKAKVHESQQNSASITEQLLTLVPPGETTDTELEEQYEDADLLADEVAIPNCTAASFGSPSNECKPPKKTLTEVFDMQVYLTGKVDLHGNVPFARIGRPNIKDLFLEMKEEATNSGDNRVAVCVSAPRKLMDHCHKACILYSDETVRFDFHSESIEN